MSDGDDVETQKVADPDNPEPKKHPEFLTLFATPWSESDVRSAVELTQKYIELVGILKVLKNQFYEGDDRLAVALQMLVEVKHFIEQDETVLRCGITEPLGAIASALRDVQQGALPTLFEEGRAANKTKYKDPTSTMTISACATACMEILMRHKSSVAESSQFVADELRKVGIVKKHEGGFITADTIRRWRNNIWQKKVAYSINRQILNDITQQLGTNSTLADAKLVVTNSVRALVSSGTALQPKKP